MQLAMWQEYWPKSANDPLLFCTGAGPKGKRQETQISRELEAAGFLNERGQPFNHKSVRSMLRQ